MSVIGVDPGVNGALALYDYRTGTLTVSDMPSWSVQVGRTMRTRVDPIELLEYFELAKVMGVELAVIEAVGGRPKQSSGFAFGYSVGLVHMAAVAARVPVETVPPQTWKKLMRVPGKKGVEKKQNEEAVMQRACEIFPDARPQFFGKLGGKRMDRAEAALLAKYAADHALGAVSPATRQTDAWFRDSVNVP